MKVVVTGSNGLVGSALVERLLCERVAVTGLNTSPCSNGYLGQFDARVVDLRDSAAIGGVLEQLQPDVVVNCAAVTAVDQCEQRPDECWRVNVDAVANLARHCARLGVRLVHLSSDFVFDGESGPYDEASPLRPLSVYGASKAASELAVAALCPDSVIARTAVPFGVLPNTKKDFVRWLYDELTARRRVRVVVDQVGNPTPTADLARMLWLLLRGAHRGIVHTVGATSISRFLLAQRVAAVFGLDATLIEPIETRQLAQLARRPMMAALSVHRAQVLGLNPQDLEHGLVWARQHLRAVSSGA